MTMVHSLLLASFFRSISYWKCWKRREAGSINTCFTARPHRRPRWLIRSGCGSKLRGTSWVRIPAGSNVCHRGCAYTVLQTVQRPGVCIAVYGTTMHYKELFLIFLVNVSVMLGHRLRRLPKITPALSLFPVLGVSTLSCGDRLYTSESDV